jgi:hypothetical protein
LNAADLGPPLQDRGLHASRLEADGERKSSEPAANDDGSRRAGRERIGSFSDWVHVSASRSA